MVYDFFFTTSVDTIISSSMWFRRESACPIEYLKGSDQTVSVLHICFQLVSSSMFITVELFSYRQFMFTQLVVALLASVHDRCDCLFQLSNTVDWRIEKLDLLAQSVCWQGKD